MIEGIAITIGEKEYTVPAVNFAGVRKIEKNLKRLQEIPQAGALSTEQLDLMLEIVLAGLSRNYPEMTKEGLEEILDLNNINEVIEAVTGQAGLKKKQAAIMKERS